MNWALKRQLLYISIVVFFLIWFGISLVSPYINKLPSCFDAKQNNGEEGIDCGGPCSKICSFKVDQLSVIWTRAFKVVPGRYNAVALIENHNKDAAIYKVKYRFRFADKDNVYIGKREGETFIKAGGKSAIFEQAIDMGNSIPVYVLFDFTELPSWNTVPEEKLSTVKILLSDIEFDDSGDVPRLSALAKNSSFLDIPDISFVAIIYDEKGNAISASRTYLESLKGEETRNIDFTWQEALNGAPAVKEIIPMFNIFNLL